MALNSRGHALKRLNLTRKTHKMDKYFRFAGCNFQQRGSDLPERELWIAVFDRAVRDAFAHHSLAKDEGFRKTATEARKTALRFFADTQSEDIGSLVWIMDATGISSQLIKKIMRDIEMTDESDPE